MGGAHAPDTHSALLEVRGQFSEVDALLPGDKGRPPALVADGLIC